MMSTNLVSCFVFFVMFGYLEKQLSMGWVVSGMLLMYTLLSQRSLLSSTNTLALVITFGVQFALSDLSVFPVLQKIHLPNDSQVLQFYPRPRLCGTVFLVFLFLFTRETTSRDDDVTFGPYEQQLRKYLLKHDPSMLHKVDNLLEKYQGREEFLMQKLQKKYEKYEGDSCPSTPSPLKKKKKQLSSPPPSREEEEVKKRELMLYDEYMLHQQQQRQERLEQQERAEREQHQADTTATWQSNSKHDRSLVCDSDSSDSSDSSEGAGVGQGVLHDEKEYGAAVYDDDEDLHLDLGQEEEEEEEEDTAAGPFGRFGGGGGGGGGRLTPELEQQGQQQQRGRGGWRSFLTSDPLNGSGAGRYGDQYQYAQQHDSWEQGQEQQWQKQQWQEQQWQEQQWEEQREGRMLDARDRAREQLRQQQQNRTRFNNY